MLEILMAGGWAMLPILVCSAVAIAIILERFWSLRRSAVIPPTPAQRLVRDALDAYDALQIELAPWLPPSVHDWHRATTG